MTGEIHYRVLILSVLTGALATFAAMAALLGPAGVSRVDACTAGSPALPAAGDCPAAARGGD